MDITKKIAIIDDCKMTCEMIAWSLQNELNCEVKCYHMAEEFLLDSDFKADLIIVDYNLNGHGFRMDGIELISSTRKPMIAISGQKDLEVAIDTIRKGACNYIQKDDDLIENMTKAAAELFAYLGEKEELKNLNQIRKRDLMRAAVICSTAVTFLCLTFFI